MLLLIDTSLKTRPQLVIPTLSDRADDWYGHNRNLDVILTKGRWQCPGRNLAWVELHKVYVQLLRKFDIRMVNSGSQPWNIRSYTTIVIGNQYVRSTEAKTE